MMQNRIVSQVTLTKWGNSQGIRLPKRILDSMHLKENDRLDICVKGEELVIHKTRNFNSLEERLEAFYGKPISEIGIIETEEEVSWGTPVGEEMW